jgi:hypothetical protein
VHGLSDKCDGNMKSDQSDHDSQPEQERNDPVLVVSMDDYASDPPSGRVSVYYSSC